MTSYCHDTPQCVWVKINKSPTDIIMSYDPSLCLNLKHSYWHAHDCHHFPALVKTHSSKLHILRDLHLYLLFSKILNNGQDLVFQHVCDAGYWCFHDDTPPTHDWVYRMEVEGLCKHCPINDNCACIDQRFHWHVSGPLAKECVCWSTTSSLTPGILVETSMVL